MKNEIIGVEEKGNEFRKYLKNNPLLNESDPIPPEDIPEDIKKKVVELRDAEEYARKMRDRMIPMHDDFDPFDRNPESAYNAANKKVRDIQEELNGLIDKAWPGNNLPDF